MRVEWEVSWESWGQAVRNQIQIAVLYLHSSPWFLSHPPFFFQPGLNLFSEDLRKCVSV